LGLEKHTLQIFAAKVDTFFLTVKGEVSTTKDTENTICLIINEIKIRLHKKTGGNGRFLTLIPPDYAYYLTLFMLKPQYACNVG
jgi:hypothetical protein